MLCIFYALSQLCFALKAGKPKSYTSKVSAAWLASFSYKGAAQQAWAPKRCGVQGYREVQKLLIGKYSRERH
jgi:hypothetical protein